MHKRMEQMYSEINMKPKVCIAVYKIISETYASMLNEPLPKK